MSQLVYLSRHAKTLQNALLTLGPPEHDELIGDIYTVGDLKSHLRLIEKTPADLEAITGIELNGKDRKHVKTYSITPEGTQQALNLGAYLVGKVVDPENILFITSTLERTHQTAKLVARQLGIPFDSAHEYSEWYDEVKMPLEMLFDEGVRSEEVPELREQGYDFANNIGKCVEEELVEALDRNLGRNVIAVFHGNLNVSLIKHLEKDLGRTMQGYAMDNCGLYVLERNGNSLKIVEGHISNKEIEQGVTRQIPVEGNY